jgi:hypothetical protein
MEILQPIFTTTALAAMLHVAFRYWVDLEKLPFVKAVPCKR